MSQRSVERTLGKMVTDEAFRTRFFTDPSRTSIEAGLDLLPEETDALLRVPRAMLERLASCLDGRICRLSVSSGQESSK
ncbi:MAG: Os1348 family NHLP clan protein [Candidatus Rokuibacteriota bacterium]